MAAITAPLAAARGFPRPKRRLTLRLQQNVMFSSSSPPYPASQPSEPLLTARRRLLIIHRGALGDFLNAWPSLLSLRRALPETPIACLTRPAHQALAERAGLERARAEDESAFPSLFGETEPEAFVDATILWLGLSAPPNIRHDDLHFLPGIRPGDPRPPRELWLEGLSRLGVKIAVDWLDAWRATVCRATGPAASKRTLLFPGSGHPLKTWPLVQFLELAHWLDRQGLEPRFVLGPQEREQGIRVADWPTVQPRDLEELLGEMRQAGTCVGADSGPMHLASLCGLPGVALFGPTSARQWGPPGLTIMRGNCPRRPCTTTTADLYCPEANCMASIRQEDVRRAFQDLAG